MAQTPQPDATGGTGNTAATGAGGPQGLFGSATTILLVVFAVAVFWWYRCRRVEMEEQIRAQRREAEVTAERCALDVAHLMRATPQPGAAAAAASQGLASAQKCRPPTSQNRVSEPRSKLRPPVPNTPQVSLKRRSPTIKLKHRPARSNAPRPEPQRSALQRSRLRPRADARNTGESLVRRMAAADEAADEAAADTADAAQGRRERRCRRAQLREMAPPTAHRSTR